MHTRRLLVPVDCSPLSEAVLPVARMLAISMDAEITILTVMQTGLPSDVTRETIDYLHDLAAAQHQLGADIQIAFRLGEPSTRIIEFVREGNIDMLVMATHGRSGLTRSVLGSVTDLVVRTSPVPVVVLRPESHVSSHLETVLVAVDGTPGGAVALAAAIPLARSAGAKLVVAQATIPLPLWIYEPTLGLNTGPLIDPMWDEDARRAAELYAEGVAGRLRRAGVEAEGIALSGQPGPVITHVADDCDADVIVMSTHARRGTARTVLGSVADDVVRRSGRPVLLVRREQAAQTPAPTPRGTTLIAC